MVRRVDGCVGVVVRACLEGMGEVDGDYGEEEGGLGGWLSDDVSASICVSFFVFEAVFFLFCGFFVFLHGADICYLPRLGAVDSQPLTTPMAYPYQQPQFPTGPDQGPGGFNVSPRLPVLHPSPRLSLFSPQFQLR